MQKLLILGTNTGTMEILAYAREKGVYTIVTDNVPYEKSLEKQMADDYWMISNRDTDALEERARIEEISAVVAGCSEIALTIAANLCARLNLPCYINRGAWKISRNKRLFKEVCQKYQIDVPFDYTNEQKISFPVIVKPTDACACRGISVCKNKRELVVAEVFAQEQSLEKAFLVEPYLEGQELVAFYLMVQDKAYFLQLDEVWLNKEGKHSLCLNVQHYLDEYLKGTDEKIKEMLEKEHFDYGPVFVQMIYRRKHFYVFEMGYRIPGNYYYLLTEKMCGINALHYIVDYALHDFHTSPMVYPYKKGAYALYEIWSGPGKIMCFSGLEDIGQRPEIIAVRKNVEKGMVITPTGTMRDIAIFILIAADEERGLWQMVEYINSHLRMYDERGDNMLCFVKGKKEYC